MLGAPNHDGVRVLDVEDSESERGAIRALALCAHGDIMGIPRSVGKPTFLRCQNKRALRCQ